MTRFELACIVWVTLAVLFAAAFWREDRKLRRTETPLADEAEAWLRQEAGRR